MSKVILITGCSSGIGSATAEFFADEGWNVVATMRHPKGRETKLKGHENIDLVHLDVTEPDSIKSAVGASSTTLKASICAAREAAA